MASKPIERPAAPPARRPHRIVLLPIVAAVVLAADQLSKHWVQAHFLYACDQDQTLIANWLSLSYTCNRGAAFGVLANETLLFVLIALVVIGVIVAYFRYLPANRPWLRISLGLQLGGASGNLVDRLHQGFVTDFIAVKSLPVFNIADASIVVGVAILAYYLFASQNQPAAPRDAGGPEPR